MSNFFFNIYQYLSKRKLPFFAFTLLLFVLLGYWASRITFEEDIAKLIPSSEASQRINAVMASANFADKIVVNIQGNDHTAPEDLQAYAAILTEVISESSAPYIDRMQGQMEEGQLEAMMSLVSDHLPLFLDDTDYRRLDTLLETANLEAVAENAYRQISSPAGLINTQLIRSDPFGMTLWGLEKLQRLQANDNYTIQRGYLMTRDLNNLLLLISTRASASETNENALLVDNLTRHIDSLNRDSDGVVFAEYFGATPMSVANARQIKQDIKVTLTIALVILISLFIYFYRRIYIPIVVLIPAAFGALLGMTVLYLIKGTISAVSIGIGSVLLGLTLDYSLHILSHYRSTGDIALLFRSTTKPLIMCAVFTAVDFFCLLFLKSEVLQDLGIFAAVSVLGAAVFALVFIPLAYAPSQAVTTRQNTFIDRMARYDYSNNRGLFGIAIGLVIVSFFTFGNVGFDNDLNRLNYQPAHLKAAEQRLMALEKSTGKSIYLLSYGDDYEEALGANSNLYDKLLEAEKKGDIQQFSSIGHVLQTTNAQAEKIQRWNGYWTADKIEQLRSGLIHAGEKVGFRPNTFAPFFGRLTKAYRPVDLTTDSLFGNLFLKDFAGSKDGLISITTQVKLDESRAPQFIETFSELPNTLTIDRKFLQEKYLSNLEADFNKLFLIASIAVFVILFIFFGNLELTLITNIPIFLGWYITLGMMGALGIDFNAFNIIITTLIFGLGVDYSIFVTKGLLEKYTYGRADLPAYKSGIIMSALATMLCFGILAFAKHPAIQSISTIPLVGLMVVVLMSFTIQPFLFNLYIQRPQDKGNTPRTIFNILLTVYTFGYFFLGSLLISIFSRLILPILPIGSKRRFNFFHRVLRGFFGGLMHGTPGTEIISIDKAHADFGKPAIVIANHTSQLDTPTMGMLHDKHIFMVNNRIMNSKFFGKAIQAAGFYVASDNEEQDLEHLRKKIAQGYSIIIFPEGTRSRTAEIGRFHKGAFFLAEKLQVDILPVMIHGNADVLPKNDNVTKGGKITIQYLRRIKPDDERFGSSYQERTKKIAAYFKSAFRQLRYQAETGNYFKKKLYFNYTYKDKAIRQEVASVFRDLGSSYRQVLPHLPLHARVLHLGCGYGVLDFLMVYDSAHRKVTAWDSDPEKVSAAQHTYSVNRFDLHFVHDVSAALEEKTTVLVVSGNTEIPVDLFSHDYSFVLFERVGKLPTAFDQTQLSLVFENTHLQLFSHGGKV